MKILLGAVCQVVNMQRASINIYIYIYIQQTFYNQKKKKIIEITCLCHLLK